MNCARTGSSRTSLSANQASCRVPARGYQDGEGPSHARLWAAARVNVGALGL